MKLRSRNRTGGRLRPMHAVLPGILLGDALVAVIAASSLATQNHQIVSMIAVALALAALVGTIGFAALRGLAVELRLALASPNEPSHVHIPRRSGGDVE